MNEAKFREALVYVCTRCSDAKNWGMVKLLKILFFADFESYERRGETITGAAYYKLRQGPVPTDTKSLQDQMIADGDIGIEVRQVIDYHEKRPVALREPDMGVFSGEEVRIIDQMIEWIKPMTAKRVSDVSHRHIGWQIVEMGQKIPYEMALLTQPHERILSAATIKEILKD
jgi:hypothetical protein